jgi:hypothetical protein
MCKHEKICIECTREEIAKLEKQIQELKRKLPSNVYTPVIPYWPVFPQYPVYPQQPYWYNQMLCGGSTTFQAGLNTINSNL